MKYIKDGWIIDEKIKINKEILNDKGMKIFFYNDYISYLERFGLEKVYLTDVIDYFECLKREGVVKWLFEQFGTKKITGKFLKIWKRITEISEDDFLKIVRILRRLPCDFIEKQRRDKKEVEIRLMHEDGWSIEFKNSVNYDTTRDYEDCLILIYYYSILKGEYYFGAKKSKASTIQEFIDKFEEITTIQDDDWKYIAIDKI